MIDRSRILTIIPARGGSRRLPGKNLKALHGKPLIEWTIDAALNTPGLLPPLVSTDDLAIQNCARVSGAEVPFLRPAELASDTATTVDVLFHAIDLVESQGRVFEWILLLQPTSPLRDAADIDGLIKLAASRDAHGGVGVCKVDHSPLWCNTLPSDHSMDEFLKPEVRQIRSQDLPTYYRINGSMYLCRLDRFRQERSLFLAKGTLAYVMDGMHSVDIDTLEDFEYAEFLMDKGRRSTHDSSAVS